MERRLDHDLSRFEMVYPGRGEDAGGGYVFEDDDEYDQDAHVSRLEEENLTLKERLFLMEQEVGDMRRRLEVLEARFSQCDGVAGGENAVEEAPPGNDAERVHGVSENSSEGDAEGVHLGSEKSEGQTAAMQAAVVSVKTGQQDAVGSEETGKHDVEEQVALGSEKAGETEAEEQGALGGSEKTSKHDAEKQGALDEQEIEMTYSEKTGEHDMEMVDSALDKKMGEDNGEIRLEAWQ